MKKNQNKKLHSHSASHSDFVPGAGLEPARPKRSQDFKSRVSTYSTTWACKKNLFLKQNSLPVAGEGLERKTGFEPATPTLARSCSTN
jgi:hypothetical protein